MKMYFTDGIGTPAATSWWLTPMPQSIKYGVSLTTTRLAGLDAPMPTRGPPLVPRKTTRVRGFPVCANVAGAANSPAVPRPSFIMARRSIMVSSQPFMLGENLAAAEHAVEGGHPEDHGEC